MVSTRRWKRSSTGACHPVDHANLTHCQLSTDNCTFLYIIVFAACRATRSPPTCNLQTQSSNAVPIPMCRPILTYTFPNCRLVVPPQLLLYLATAPEEKVCTRLTLNSQPIGPTISSDMLLFQSADQVRRGRRACRLQLRGWRRRLRDPRLPRHGRLRVHAL